MDIKCQEYLTSREDSDVIIFYLFFLFKKNMYLFIWLCQVLAEAWRIFDLRCSM